MSCENAWERALLAAGNQDFRWHDTQHKAVSYLRMSGATLADSADVLGQKTLVMVKRYSHLPDQSKRIKVVEMNQQFLPNDLVEKAMKFKKDDDEPSCCDLPPGIGS